MFSLRLGFREAAFGRSVLKEDVALALALLRFEFDESRSRIDSAKCRLLGWAIRELGGAAADVGRGIDLRRARRKQTTGRTGAANPSAFVVQRDVLIAFWPRTRTARVDALLFQTARYLTQLRRFRPAIKRPSEFCRTRTRSIGSSCVKWAGRVADGGQAFASSSLDASAPGFYLRGALVRLASPCTRRCLCFYFCRTLSSIGPAG